LDAAFVAMGATKAAEERMVQAAAINSGPVIYLTGVGGTSHNNSSHTYSNVNVAASNSHKEVVGDNISRPPSQQAIAVNVAAPFCSPLLFGDTSADLGTQQYLSSNNEILVDPQVDDPIEMLFASIG
jgi:hypothetical protein